MKLSYDSEVDILTIRLSDARIRESDEIEPGFIVDYGFEHEIVGFEILNASRKIDDVDQVELDNLRPVTPVH